MAVGHLAMMDPVHLSDTLIGPSWWKGTWEGIGQILFFGVIFSGSVRCRVLAAGALDQSRVIS